MSADGGAARWQLGLVVALVAAVGATGLPGVFQFDDWNVIVGEPTVHSLAAWLADFGHGIRPLLKLSYALNWVAGPGELGFHLVNLGIHVTATVLAYGLARALARRMGEHAARQADRCAAATALLFGLHPAATEAVTYLSGRSTSLMTMLTLGGMLAYLAGERRDRRVLRLVVAPLLFVLAVAAKEVAVTFPLALLLVELARRDRAPHGLLVPPAVRAGPSVGRARSPARALAPYAVLLALAAAALLLHPTYGPRLTPEWALPALQRNALAQVDAVSYLALRLAWIYPLNIDPHFVPVTTPTLALVAKFVALAAALVLGLWALRRRPWLGFGVLWFFLQLVPTNTLLPRADLANERQLYVAGFGVWFALAMEWSLALARGRRWLRPAGAIVVVALAVFTIVRNQDYASEIALWEQTARGSPAKPRVFNNLGYAYHLAGCVAAAERAYLRALALDPGDALARDNLANLRRGHDVGPGGARCPK